jgi:hypothetical protein
MNCNINFLNYIKTENVDELKTCIKYFENIINTYDKEIKEDVKNSNKCIILSQKRKDKYIHKYDVSNILKKICELKTELPEGYLENFLENFEIKPRENCCNCISVVLYSDMNEYGLSTYLPNFLVSLKNIEEHLPNWIFRVYLDSSVFQLIYNLEYDSEGKKISCETINSGCEYRKILEYISNHPNCEIYLSLCKKRYEEKFSMSSLRTQRFTGFIDEEVNINACRDADGIVAVFDCYNLKIFEKSDFIFFAYPFKYTFMPSAHNNNLHYSYDGDGIWKTKYYNDIYGNKIDIKKTFIYDDYGYNARWLRFYKLFSNILELNSNYFNPDFVPFYQEHTSIIPLLAGLITSKCTIKKNVYDNNVDKINKFLILFSETFNDKLGDYNVSILLKVGFDEILLMKLFEPIFSSKYIINDGELILLNSKKILELIGLCINNYSIKTLDYNYCIDISDYVMQTEDCNFNLNDEQQKELIDSVFKYDDPEFNKKEGDNFLYSLCFDKNNEYKKLDFLRTPINKHKFIYPSKYFFNFLNLNIKYLNHSNKSKYVWFLDFFNIKFINNMDLLKYKNKYLKYKNKYLELKNKNLFIDNVYQIRKAIKSMEDY